MRVALFGGTGFVGSYIVDALIAAGHEPRLLVRSGSEDKVSEPGRCTTVLGDIGDSETIRKTLDGAEAAIYCIGILAEDRKRGVTFEGTQYRGVQHVIEAAETSGVRRFLLMSANGVRADGTAYQTTKYRAERALAASGIPYDVFRPSVIFGDPRDRMEIATQLYRDLVSPPLPAVGFQNGWWPGQSPVQMSPVAVQDVADAFVSALDEPGRSNSEFHLGGPEILSWSEMVRRVAAARNRRKWILPMPIPLMKLAAHAFGWLPIFPVSVDQLTMLAEGNTAPPDDLVNLIGRPPRRFDAAGLQYLADPT